MWGRGLKLCATAVVDGITTILLYIEDDNGDTDEEATTVATLHAALWPWQSVRDDVLPVSVLGQRCPDVGGGRRRRYVAKVHQIRRVL